MDVDLLHCCKLICKATQPVYFIKPNVIRNLAYKVKYISQTNEDLIMFSEIQEYEFLKLIISIVKNMERINSRKRNTVNNSVFKMLLYLSYYLNVRIPLIILLTFIFLSCREWVNIMITVSLVVKIHDLVVNYESRLVKSSHVIA